MLASAGSQRTGFNLQDFECFGAVSRSHHLFSLSHCHPWDHQRCSKLANAQCELGVCWEPASLRALASGINPSSWSLPSSLSHPIYKVWQEGCELRWACLFFVCVLTFLHVCFYLRDEALHTLAAPAFIQKGIKIEGNKSWSKRDLHFSPVRNISDWDLWICFKQ